MTETISFFSPLMQTETTILKPIIKYVNQTVFCNVWNYNIINQLGGNRIEQYVQCMYHDGILNAISLLFVVISFYIADEVLRIYAIFLSNDTICYFFPECRVQFYYHRLSKFMFVHYIYIKHEGFYSSLKFRCRIFVG